MSDSVLCRFFSESRLTRSSLGSQVSQYGNGLFTLLDATALDGFDKVALLVERPTLAAEFKTLLAGDLGDGTAGSQVTLEDSGEWWLAISYHAESGDGLR